ncbi:homoserine dehydrogenase [Caldichromatium japonicum]|uniref:Homoserine dehydrogenase n=1 Tax=Caldichromatium japonicum TaxID=2699430 RepID=A0A6G7VE70_9GAMM|nr:homoserine dehydrogenase [Caldichromatium japonicum]QIK38148.1 homoserine dehydrogenase [Caldichromatium japonicum]
MEAVSIGILGLGTVGGGTVTVLTRNAREIARRAGRGIEIARAAARDYRPERIEGLNQIGQIGTDLFAVVEDPSIQVIVELIGGESPAFELVMRAIETGKHVVTANKALIAKRGNEIFGAARRRGVMVGFEAAVAGGIPIIKALREGLAANHIEWIAGIINGTGNFILTQMRDHGCDFAAALADAQARGYAEVDPTLDIEGIDAAHKLTILASLAFGIPLQFEHCFTEGISRIDPEDIANAAELGYRIKHLGIARRSAGGIELRVHPTLLPERRLLANVDGVMNAILVKGDAVGPTLFYGAGAGALPTASSVVADLIDVVRALTTDPNHRVPHLAFQPDELVDIPILPMDAIQTSYYLRLTALDRLGVMGRIATILGEEGVSIEAIEQRAPAAGETHVTLVMLTHRVIEGQMNRAIARIEALDTVQGRVKRIRMESLSG